MPIRSSLWHGQPHLGTMPAGNILLSACSYHVFRSSCDEDAESVACISARTYFRHQKTIHHCMGVACISARTYFRHQKTIHHCMGVACISARTYFRHQKTIVQRAVHRVWKEGQEWHYPKYKMGGHIVRKLPCSQTHLPRRVVHMFNLHGGNS